MLNKTKIAVIGSGVAGIATAAHLARSGAEVHVFEKNNQIGGRARKFEANGFTFDMGPSWYWMPDVIDRFFDHFGKKTTDYFELVKLDPGFQMVFNESEPTAIPASWEELEDLFESIEPGAKNYLNKFMDEAEFKYNVGVKDLVYQPGLSIKELIRPDLIISVFKLQVFSSFHTHVRKFFTNPKLIALMEFPVLFLGAMPKQTPALYSLMNYTGLKVGTFYPMGGFNELVKAMVSVAQEQGAKFHVDSQVDNIFVNDNKAKGLTINNQFHEFDAVVGAADYNHVEQHLLPEQYRTYDKKYWDSRVFAPSCLLFYLGVDEKLEKLNHHNLFFDENLDQHAVEIYEKPEWPTKPLFYACCPSKTDDSVAPEGKENLFVLMPIAPGLEDTDEVREKYYNILLGKLESYTGQDIRSKVIYKRGYCVKDFELDYNAFKGNAYGLANTLGQTANLKPKMKSSKVENLYYAGQLTVPGPGVPPSIISGEVCANQIIKKFKL